MKPLTVEMDGPASREWDRVVGLLGGSLTSADVGVLVSYCLSFSLVYHTRRALAPPPAPKVDKLGRKLSGKALAKAQAAEAEAPWQMTTVDGKGNPRTNPLVTVLTCATRDLAKFADALGLTPTARARVGAMAAPAEDAFDAWLKANKRG
ncbi:P27 family phage terminase small subunit [Paludisphaera rhizosphaerae]|uniref:P27 family phage terminase small subunit n=1 Tax=Paludisphaera rhizosphaerae TaxID=2711216 RepID=UPI0013EAD069|nr:P27 family phage terminase small subunit [Paludisphaera rhizosphaerae]